MFRLDNGGTLIARVSGIPIYGTVWLAIMIGFFALKAFMEGSLWALIWILVLFVSVLLHELGHAFAARRCGSRVLRITLHIFGGLIEHTGGATWRQRVFISLAGPAVNVVLGAIAIGALLVFQTSAGLNHDVLLAFAVVNVVLMLFNVLPIYPLDGGQVARNLLERRLRAKLAAYWGSVVSVVVLAAVGVVHLLVMQPSFLALALLGFLALHNIMVLRANHSFAKRHPIRLRTLFPRAKPGQTKDKTDPKRSVKRIQKFLNRAVRNGLDSLEPEQRGVLLWHRTLLERKVLDKGLSSLTVEEQDLLDLHHEVARARAGLA